MNKAEQLKEAISIIEDLIFMIKNVTCDNAWANGVDEGTVKSREFFRELEKRHKKIKEEQKGLQLD